MKTENEIKEEYYAKADKVTTLEDFNNLYEELIKEELDYGTVVYACYAMMKAGFNVMNRGPHGGITGFQAGFIGWEAVKEFMHIRGPAKVLSYEDLLYPQYDYKFRNTISRTTLMQLQELAKEKLNKDGNVAHPNVVGRWTLFAEGGLPEGFTITEE